MPLAKTGSVFWGQANLCRLRYALLTGWEHVVAIALLMQLHPGLTDSEIAVVGIEPKAMERSSSLSEQGRKSITDVAKIFKGKNVVKRLILLIALVSLGMTDPARAKENKLGVTFDVTYVSKWLSKGVESYGQQGALFKTIDLDLYSTGLGVKITHRNATSSGYVDNQRFDYRPYYKNRFFVGESYATNYDLSVGYEHYPGLARNKANTTFEDIRFFLA